MRDAPKNHDRPSLVAILERTEKTNALVVLDLVEGRTFLATRDDLARIIAENLTMMVDAQASLKAWEIDPLPDLNIICLSTIKKLIAKNHHERIHLPSFNTDEDALWWFKVAAEEAFDRIHKLDMVALNALESKVILATLSMEKRGLPFKKEQWQDRLKVIEQETKILRQRLEDILPNESGFLLFGQEPLDLNNANTVKSALEKVLGVKLAGTSQSSLKDYDHEAVKLMLRYREHARMLSNFGEGFLAKIHHDRLSGHYTPLGSASGRFACHDTNLLALPNDEIFQSCLIPKPPYLVCHFDYAAFELRILAAESGDETLIQIFHDGHDIHSMVAQEIFGVKVSKSENAHLRSQAKVLNFGLIYGMGEASLAKQLKISKSEAQTMLSNYFKRFARVKDYVASLEVMAQTKGYVKTALNRRAYFTNGEDKGHIARLARNIPIQGTGADIVKLALCRVHRRLHEAKLDAHIINVIHDEIVLETHEENLWEASSVVIEEMKEAFRLICPSVPAAIGS